MAVNDTNSPGAAGFPQSQAPFGAAPAPAPAQPKQDQQVNQQTTQVSIDPTVNQWDRYSQEWSTPLLRGAAPEMLTVLQEKMQKILDRVSTTFGKFKAIALENKALGPNVIYSSLLVCAEYSDSVEVFCNMLVGSNPDFQLPPHVENTATETTQMPSVPSEAFDTMYVTHMIKFVKALYPGKNVVLAGSSTIPARFKWQDDAQVMAMAVNNTHAIITRMAARDGRQDLNVALFGATSNLTMTANYGRETIRDANGEVLRADFRIDLRERPKQLTTADNARRSLNEASSNGSTVGSVYAFVEPIYVGSPADAMLGMGQSFSQINPMVANQKFAARGVISLIEMPGISTPATSLMMIGITGVMASNDRWKNVYMHQVSDSKKGYNLGDVGALNIDVNIQQGQAQQPNIFALEQLGKRMSTNPSMCNPGQLASFMGQIFRPGMMIAIDVPLGGASSWSTELFRLALGGDAIAIKAIEVSADNLTNNHYGLVKKELLGENPKDFSIFVKDANLNWTGYWYDLDGVERSFSEFDYLAMLNIFGDRPETYNRVREYAATFFENGESALRRLNKRLELIKLAAGGQAWETGQSLRCTFSDMFIRILTTSMTRAGLNTSSQNFSNVSSMTQSRPVAAWANQALVNLSGADSFVNNSTNSVANPNGSGFNIRQYGAYGRPL